MKKLQKLIEKKNSSNRRNNDEVKELETILEEHKDELDRLKLEAKLAKEITLKYKLIIGFVAFATGVLSCAFLTKWLVLILSGG